MRITRTWVAALAIIAAACGGATAADTTLVPSTGTPAADASSTTPAPSLTQSPSTTDAAVDDDTAELELPFDLAFLREVWPTNWARRTVDLDELNVGISAIDPRDLIRPIDDPVYEEVASADQWLEDREPGILLEVADEPIFFPIRILMSHEIVNDERSGVPFSLTYCPLCNTAVGFDRRVDGSVLRFGVSGLLRNSDLVMWDDATVSLWQQTTGEAIVGDMAGTRLEFLPTAVIRWGDFKATHSGGDVLSRESGPFTYGSNGYVGYSSRSGPFRPFFPGEIDDRFESLSRVVGVRVGDATKAYPFSSIRENGAVNDEVAGVPILVLWGAADTADPLDAGLVAEGDAIGTGIAFLRTVDGQVLTFMANGDDTFIDAETGTTWSLLGAGLDGPLAGTELEPAIHQNEFWFAWAAFNRGAPVYGLD